MDLNAGHYWKSLITRYGPPLEPENLDVYTLKLAVAEQRALKVITQRDGFGSGYLYLCRAQVDDAIRGKEPGSWGNSYFCIVFPHPCELTNEEVEVLGHGKESSRYSVWALIDLSTMPRQSNRSSNGNSNRCKRRLNRDLLNILGIKPCSLR
jgi:hypothetical protein